MPADSQKLWIKLNVIKQYKLFVIIKINNISLWHFIQFYHRFYRFRSLLVNNGLRNSEGNNNICLRKQKFSLKTQHCPKRTRHLLRTPSIDAIC